MFFHFHNAMMSTANAMFTTLQHTQHNNIHNASPSAMLTLHWDVVKSVTSYSVTDLVKIQTKSNPFFPSFKLFLHVHQIECWQGIYYCSTHGTCTKDWCWVTCLADWSKFIASPGIADITIPCMLHHLHVEVNATPHIYYHLLSLLLPNSLNCSQPENNNRLVLVVRTVHMTFSMQLKWSCNMQILVWTMELTRICMSHDHFGCPNKSCA